MWEVSKTKPPKLDLGACEDKGEIVELWLNPFNNWFVLQGFRDTAKSTIDPAHWKSAHHASEISAFRLALPVDVLRTVKSTISPTIATTSGKNNGNTFIGNPCVWQRKLLFYYAGQDSVLAERINFIEICKQKPHKSVAEFEAWCNYHVCKCKHKKMKNPEQELIQDKFMSGIYNDKLRGELLWHRKDDGLVVTLAEVFNKTKAWEAANNSYTKVMEAQHTDEQVNYTSRKQQQSSSEEQTFKKGRK